MGSKNSTRHTHILKIFTEEPYISGKEPNLSHLFRVGFGDEFQKLFAWHLQVWRQWKVHHLSLFFFGGFIQFSPPPAYFWDFWERERRYALRMAFAGVASMKSPPPLPSFFFGLASMKKFIISSLDFRKKDEKLVAWHIKSWCWRWCKKLHHFRLFCWGLGFGFGCLEVMVQGLDLQVWH